MYSSNKCEEFIELLSAYHDDELEGEECLALERHLAACSDCSKQLREIASMVKGMKSLQRGQLKKEIDFSFLESESNAPVNKPLLPVKADCKPVFEMLDAYRDSELSKDESELVSKHLADCEFCASSFAGIKQIAGALAALPRLKPSRDILESLDFATLSITDLHSPGCDDVFEFLDAYHDAELSAKEKSMVDRHLAVCDDCLKKLQEIKRVVEDVKALPRVQAQRDIIEAMDFGAKHETNIKAPKSNVVSFGRTAKFGICTAVAAAVALIFMINFKPVQVAVVNPDSNSPIETKAPLLLPESNTDKPADSSPPPETASNIDDKNDLLQTHSNTGTGSSEDHSSSPRVKNNEIAEMPVDFPTSHNSHHEAINMEIQRRADNAEIAIMPESGNGACAEALGVGTDEDGLYDIKI